jgi:hypothetical protein
MSATAEWMQKVMRNLVSPGKAGPTTVVEDDEDGIQAQDAEHCFEDIGQEAKGKEGQVACFEAREESSSREEGQREGEVRESADSRC